MGLSKSLSFRQNQLPAVSTQPSNSYILALQVLQNPNLYVASEVSSSPFSSTIDLFDPTTLNKVHSFVGQSSAIATLGTTGSVLIAAGKDGYVHLWDIRAQADAVTFSATNKRPLLCVDSDRDGNTIAAGSTLVADEAIIAYWDSRNPSTELRVHSSTHSDDVTSVKFYKGIPCTTSLGENATQLNKNTLLSSSTDGLLNVSDGTQDDEDEAVIFTGNWGCSISRAGWIYPSAGAASLSVWAASDMETYSSWNAELDPLTSIDIRKPVAHSHGLEWVSDYIIDGGENVFVGSNEGDVALISPVSSGATDGAEPYSPTPHPGSLADNWTIHSTWTRGHTGVVRAAVFDRGNLITGGEDGKINLWAPSIASQPEMSMDAPRGIIRSRDDEDRMDVDIHDIKQKGKRTRRS